MKVYIPYEAINIPNNEIWYTTTDGEIFELFDIESEGAQYEYTLVSNTYENGIGKMVFDQDVKSLGIDDFNEKVYPILGSFDDNSNLQTIQLPNSITSFNNFSFNGNLYLTNVVISNSVTYIGVCTFYACTSFTSVEISNSVTSIGRRAFSTCVNLTSVIIGNSVMSIGEWAFEDCVSLANIKYNGTVAQWNAITKESEWCRRVPATVVTCTDGTVALD